MSTITKKQLQQLRKQYPVGCVVKLISMDDSFAPKIGTLGKVFYVDDTGTIHENWDNSFIYTMQNFKMGTRVI